MTERYRQKKAKREDTSKEELRGGKEKRTRVEDKKVYTLEETWFRQVCFHILYSVFYPVSSYSPYNF